MTILKSNPAKISGNWSAGYTLDLHIESSEYLGDDSNGRPRFDTVRTEIGEAIYQLKYSGGGEVEARNLAATAAAFIKKWDLKIDGIVAMPPSKNRKVQPVALVASHLAKALKVELISGVTKSRATPELKNITDLTERQKLLKGAHQVDPANLKGRNILLFDDLYQSGATMNAVADILRSKGGAAKVYALALTRTKR